MLGESSARLPGEALARKVAPWLLFAAVSWLAFRAFVAGRTKAFALDEFYYAHHTWTLTRSAEALYATLLEGTRFVTSFVLAPVVLLAGDEPSRMIWVRLFMLPIFFASLALLGTLAHRHAPAGQKVLASLLTLFFALSLQPLVWHAVEIRPDSIALCLVLLALVLMGSRSLPRAGPALAGVCLFLGCFTSIKVVVYGSVLALFFLGDLGARRRARSEVLGNSLCFAGGFAAGCALLALAVLSAGTGAEFYDGFYGSSRLHQHYYPEIEWSRFLLPFLYDSKLVLGLAALGAVAVCVRSGRGFRRGSVDPALAIVLLALGALASYLIQKAAYPYSLIPFAAFVAVLAAWGTTQSLAVAARIAHPIVRSGIALGLACMLAWIAYAAHERLDVTQDNARQIEVQAAIGRLTAPDDVVYDMSGSFFARPRAHRLAFVDDARRLRYGEARLIREIERDLVDREAVLFVHDIRFEINFDDTPLGRFVRRNYQRYNDDLRLWGKSWSTRRAFEDEFWAIRSGKYFVHPPELAPGLRIDGTPLSEPIVALEKGEHRLSFRPVDRSRRTLYLIWLPRDGRPFDPAARHPRRSLGQFVLP